jgi:predicted tellurium resistance membrane protein TerC
MDTDIVRQVLSLIVVILFSWFYYYLDKLEKIGCACALNKTRTLLMVSIGVIVVLRLVDAVFPLPNLAQLLVTFASLAFVILAFVYIRRLKNEKCKCSETTARDVMEVYIWLVVGIWILAAILLLVALFNVFAVGASSIIEQKAGKTFRTRR